MAYKFQPVKTCIYLFSVLGYIAEADHLWQIWKYGNLIASFIIKSTISNFECFFQGHWFPQSYRWLNLTCQGQVERLSAKPNYPGAAVVWFQGKNLLTLHTRS